MRPSLKYACLAICVVGVGATPAIPTKVESRVPKATVLNGSYYGVHQSTYNQDLFLGVPFAEPPLGKLRFANPLSLNSTWNGSVPATSYSAACVGYGSDSVGLEQSEDCLYMNIIRPSGYANTSLPVAVWLHGGGFVQGSAVDPQYNLSFIVEKSVKIGKPIIATSINYRLGALGFLNGNDVANEGVTNLGLKDQRIALHWIQENIAGFGGDPSKVTIWGESAGASSVGFHLLAFNGRDDELFRAGIMESGNPIFWTSLNTTKDYQESYDALVNVAGCSNSSAHLDCLREVPFPVLNNILNTTQFQENPVWLPAIDGDFIARYGSEQLADGSFVHVPIISGANSDEGESFGPTGIYNTSDFVNAINNAIISQTTHPLPKNITNALLRAYPSDPTTGIPSSTTLGGNLTLPSPYGPHYRRSAAYFGDENVIAARRLTCQTWSKANIPAYCYRFNAIPNGNTWPIAVTHFSEVALVFHNVMGVGMEVNPFLNQGRGYAELSELMCGSWVGFVSDLDPNGWRGGVRWERYDVWGGEARDFVFDANVTSFGEVDSWRGEGMGIINANWHLYHR